MITVKVSAPNNLHMRRRPVRRRGRRAGFGDRAAATAGERNLNPYSGNVELIGISFAWNEGPTAAKIATVDSAGEPAPAADTTAAPTEEPFVPRCVRISVLTRNPHTLTRSHAHAFTRSHAHTRTRTHAHTLTRSHAHTRTRTHPRTLTRSHAHTITLTRSLAHTLKAGRGLTDGAVVAL